MELGEKLREARMERDLSLLDVQEKTKIQKRYLEAIEAGNFSILPGSFYTRAFIREFALVVGLNPDELLEEYAESLPNSAEEDFERLSRVQKSRSQDNTNRNNAIFSIIPKLLTAILIIGIIALVWYLLQKEVDPENEGPVDQTNEVEIQRGNEAIEDQKEDENVDEGEASGEETDQQTEETEPEPDPEPTMEIKLVDQNGNGIPSGVYEVSNTDELIITMETDKNSWLDIKNQNGKVIYSDDFSSDESPKDFDVTNETEVRLNVGLAKELNIKINDQQLEYPFDPSKNVHQIITIKYLKETNQ